MTAGSVSVPQVIPLRIPLPGKSKHEIDTNTLIEIKSDTPEVSIYYTLDGSKPELIRKPGYGERNTFKYKGPIILPVGKIMVKALAVTKDCRESTVVTKVFLVEYKQPNILFSVEDDNKNFLKGIATQVSFNNCNPLCEYKMLYLILLLFYAFCKYSLTKAEELSLFQFASSSAVTSGKSLASTQVARIQRETDFLKCAHCSAPRLSDPFAHFCQECGSPIPPVPVRRFPPPEGDQMAPCLECRHLVPMNTPTCIVCESPIAPQLQPQTNICIKGKVICQACGTGNPLHHKHCVTCESKLPEMQTPMFRGDTPPPYHSQQKKTVSCSKCNRVNQCDARFCDWCGAKPGPPPSYFSCFKCGASNHPYARFCGSCGIYIEPPSRVGSHSGSVVDAKKFQAQVAWQPLPISLPKSRPELKEREDKGTQTIGLFYPSSKLLEKKELELISQKEKLEKMSDHKPLLSAISPGKGYWRRQLDHVCAHLRSYAQNNLEFRALIGEPRMGKTFTKKGHGLVILRLSYAAFMCHCVHFPPLLKGRIWPTYLYFHYVNEMLPFSVFPQPESRQLLDELGPNGKGRITLVEQLLSEVSYCLLKFPSPTDPNCISDKDQPALTVAVLNKHVEAISLLVQKGADVDQQTGLHNNTALHEAVLLGSEGEECVRALLRCNASIKKKNAKGQSAYDLAVTAGNNEVISLFASKLGQGTLDKLMKPRNSGLISV
uniref:Double zinc ribbon and ankyrin repeat-containing protein 1 n=1 Tax=Athene cunicularia TaxID=194338 RepID=A0A663MJJ6_ATHCN